MKTNFSLKKRIVIAFTIQTLLVAVIAFSTISLYVDYIEETVLYEHLSKYLDAYEQELNNNKKPITPSDIRIHQQGHREVPEFARNLGPGGHEITLKNGNSFHVLSRQYDSGGLVLIKDQTDFEKKEDSINTLTLFVLFLFSVVSFVFSKSLADRIIQPVVDLSEKVSDLNVDNFNHIKLDYPNDEIGALVKVIYDHINTLNHYLQREKWFTGDISHELRTPIMIISSSTDLLKQNSTTPEQREKIYQNIDKAITNVNELINTFLLLARGKLKNQDKSALCNLSDIAHEVVTNLESYVGKKDISIKIASDDSILLPVNPALLSIVLSNLVKNAIFNTEQGEIIVDLQKDGFQVKDTGTGLPDVVKQFINGSGLITSYRNNQFGLGLSIVKRVCEQEKWKIIAYDRDKGGSCFMINF